MNDSKNISENYEKDNSLSAKLYKEINEFSQDPKNYKKLILEKELFKKYYNFFCEEIIDGKSKIFSLLFSLIKSIFTSKDKTAYAFIFSLTPVICSLHLLKNYSLIKENQSKNVEGLDVIIMELMNFLKDIQQSTTEIEKEKLSEKESQTTILNFFGDFNSKYSELLKNNENEQEILTLKEEKKSYSNLEIYEYLMLSYSKYLECYPEYTFYEFVQFASIISGEQLNIENLKNRNFDEKDSKISIFLFRLSERTLEIVLLNLYFISSKWLKNMREVCDKVMKNIYLKACNENKYRAIYLYKCIKDISDDDFENL